MIGSRIIFKPLIVVMSLLLFPWTGAAQDQPAKPKILAPCKQCHAPDEKLLRGTLGNLSQKAETFSINAGAIWTVRFDDGTKLTGWNAPISKIPKEKEISVSFVERDGELYARSVSVKPPARIPAEKLVNVEQMAEHVEKGDAFIVDSRPSARFFEGAIPGAINIYDAQFDNNTDKLPKDKNQLLIFYCAGPT